MGIQTTVLISFQRWRRSAVLEFTLKCAEAELAQYTERQVYNNKPGEKISFTICRPSLWAHSHDESSRVSLFEQSEVDKIVRLFEQ